MLGDIEANRLVALTAANPSNRVHELDERHRREAAVRSHDDEADELNAQLAWIPRNEAGRPAPLGPCEHAGQQCASGAANRQASEAMVRVLRSMGVLQVERCANGALRAAGPVRR